MAGSTLACHFRIVLLYLALIHGFASRPVSSTDSIQSTCERTPYTDLCLSTLQSDPESATDDLKGFAATTIHAASVRAINISFNIHDKLGTTDDSHLQQCFRDCYENFMDAVDELDDSLGALDSGSYKDINMWVSAAMSDAGSCAEGFQEQGKLKSPIIENTEEFSRLCSNALAIIKQLQGEI